MISLRLLFILVFCVTTSLATQFDVHNANDFVTLVNKAANGDFNYDIVLWIDLDFTNDTLRSVVDNLPLGMKSNTDCTPYSGTFDGRGHIVKNLEMTDKEYSGLICDSRDAVIKNLVIDKTCSFSGNIVGGVTVNVSGSISVSKVEIYGRMNGRNVSGGIMGIVSDVNGGSIVVDDCGFHGTVVHEESSEDSSFYGGGFIGRITSCVDTNLLFSNNENDGTFNSVLNALDGSYISSNIGGYVGGLTDYLFMKLEIRDNVNKASFQVSSKGTNGQTYVAGYTGYMWGINATLVVKNNKNDGSMLLTSNYSRFFSGGYIGLFNDQGTSDIIFESNTNDGTIQVASKQDSNSFSVGGFCGYFYIGKERVLDFINNTNNANIIAEANNTGTDTFSGFVGTLYSYFSATDKPEVRFINNINNGNIGITGTSSLYISGFVGYIYPYGTGSVYFYNNINNGDMNTEIPVESYNSYNRYVGGFAARVYSGSGVTEDYFQLHFLNNVNNGGIKARGFSCYYTGGFAGHVSIYKEREFFFKNNINYGVIDIGSTTSNSYTGGFVGQFYLSYATDDQKNHIVNNTNHANINLHDCSSVNVGSLVGYYYQSESIEFKLCNNTNNGNFTIQSNSSAYSGRGYVGGLIGNFDFSGKRQNQQLIANNINNGEILVEFNISSGFCVGGFAGSFSPDRMGEFYFCDNTNNGDLNVRADTSSQSNVGGFVGFFDSDYSLHAYLCRNTNNGGILVGVNSSSSFWQIGGFMGYGYFSCSNESGFFDNTNNCEMHANAFCYFGGFLGYATIVNSELFYTSNNINKGDIYKTTNVKSVVSLESRIGGMAGYLFFGGGHKGLFNGNINKGAINVLVDESTSNCNYEYIGGLVGSYTFSSSNSFLVYENFNSGRIQATGVSYYYCGGLFGSGSDNGSTNSLFYNNTNSGDLGVRTVDKDGACSSHIGGIAGSFSSSSEIFNITNNGKLELDGPSRASLGGFSGWFSLSRVEDCGFYNVTNNGNINVKVNNSETSYIGGIVGYYSVSSLKEHEFYGSKNNGDMSVESINTMLHAGGLIGALDIENTGCFSFTENINCGFFKTNGTSASAFFGGMIGTTRISLPVIESHNFSAIKNKNNGNSSFNLKSSISNTKFEYDTGGLFGTFVSGSIFSAKIESNTNDGSIEGTVETGSIYAGGIVGGMPSAANVSVVGNTNKAMIKITCPEVDEFQSFVGGIMGMYSNSSLMKMNLRDNANYGDIISECIRHEVGTCGLVCSTDNEGESEMTIENCVNHGDVEGSVAYGICDVVKKAKNVVNIGEVSGTRETYSIWKELRDGATSVYCGSATCTNCNKNVKSIVLDKNDGRYHVVEDNKVIVDEALNEEVDKEGYEKRWDKELKLRRYVNVYIGSPVDRKVIVYVGTSMEESGVPEDITKYHLIPEGKSAKTDNEVKKTTIIEEELHLVPYYLVTISGAVNEKIYIRADKKQNLGDISKKLKEYFESKEYAIGNTDTNELYEGERSVNGDLNIAVMRRNTVVIEMEGESVLAVDVNANEIAEEISVLTGIDTDNILVNIISDDNGYILRIIVVLKDVDLCDDVAAAINSLVKGEKCNAGILCRSREARIILPGQDISIGNRIGVCFEPKILGWFISLLMMEMAVLL